MLQAQLACFNEFPTRCKGCPEYMESRQDQTENLIWLAGMGFAYPQQNVKITKECKAFHKRSVEYQQ